MSASRGDLIEVLHDQLQLMRPASLIARECLGPALERNAIEAGFGDRESSTLRHVLEPKLDERHRLGRVVGTAVDRVRMPTKREEAHRLDPLDVEFEGEARVGLLELRDLWIDLRRGDPPGEPSARRKLAIEFDAEPGAELLCFAQRPPDALARRTQDHS